MTENVRRSYGGSALLVGSAELRAVDDGSYAATGGKGRSMQSKDI